MPAYLLGEKRLSRRLPEYVGLGDEAEAVAYAAQGIRSWEQTEGARDWLRQQWGTRKGRG